MQQPWIYRRYPNANITRWWDPEDLDYSIFQYDDGHTSVVSVFGLEFPLPRNWVIV